MRKEVKVYPGENAPPEWWQPRLLRYHHPERGGKLPWIANLATLVLFVPAALCMWALDIFYPLYVPKHDPHDMYPPPEKEV